MREKLKVQNFVTWVTCLKQMGMWFGSY